MTWHDSAPPNALRGICRIRINGVSQEERVRRIRRHQRELERLWTARMVELVGVDNCRESLRWVRKQAEWTKEARAEDALDYMDLAGHHITTIRAIDARTELLRAALRRLGA